MCKNRFLNYVGNSLTVYFSTGHCIVIKIAVKEDTDTKLALPGLW